MAVDRLDFGQRQWRPCVFAGDPWLVFDRLTAHEMPTSVPFFFA
jgi:hypothetical protein